jgi:hypothetical protein
MGNGASMTIRSHPPGYHCAKALRRLGFDEHAIANSLRRELALNTGEIEAVLRHPITPPDGVPITIVEPVVDVTDGSMDHPRRRRSDVGPASRAASAE